VFKHKLATGRGKGYESLLADYSNKFPVAYDFYCKSFEIF